MIQFCIQFPFCFIQFGMLLLNSYIFSFCSIFTFGSSHIPKGTVKICVGRGGVGKESIPNTSNQKLVSSECFVLIKSYGKNANLASESKIHKYFS